MDGNTSNTALFTSQDGAVVDDSGLNVTAAIGEEVAVEVAVEPVPEQRGGDATVNPDELAESSDDEPEEVVPDPKKGDAGPVVTEASEQPVPAWFLVAQQEQRALHAAELQAQRENLETTMAAAVAAAVEQGRRLATVAAGKQSEPSPTKAARKQAAKDLKAAASAAAQKAARPEKGQGSGRSQATRIADRAESEDDVPIPKKDMALVLAQDKLRVHLRQERRLRDLIEVCDSVAERRKSERELRQLSVETGELEKMVIGGQHMTLREWKEFVDEQQELFAKNAVSPSELQNVQVSDVGFTPVPRKRAARVPSVHFGQLAQCVAAYRDTDRDIDVQNGSIATSTPRTSAQKSADNQEHMAELARTATIARQLKRQKVAEEHALLQEAQQQTRIEAQAIAARLEEYEKSMQELTESEVTDSDTDSDTTSQEVKQAKSQKAAQARAEARKREDDYRKEQAEKDRAAAPAKEVTKEGGKRSREASPDRRVTKSPKNGVRSLSALLRAHIRDLEPLWLHPLHVRSTAEYSHHVTAKQVPKYAGDYQDPYTVIEWLEEVAQLFFQVAGVPLDRAVGILGQCFPIASPARVLFMKITREDPTIDFASLATLLVEKFHGQHIQEGYSAQLHALQQGASKIRAFVSKHTGLWARVHPDSTEEQQMLDLSHRLGGADAKEFRKWEVRMDRKGHTHRRTMQDLMAHLVEKERDRTQDSPKGSTFNLNHGTPSSQKSQKHPKKAAEVEKKSRKPKPDYTPPNCQACGTPDHKTGATGPAGCQAHRYTCYTCQKEGHFKDSPQCTMQGQKAPRRVFGTTGKKSAGGA